MISALEEKQSLLPFRANEYGASGPTKKPSLVESMSGVGPSRRKLMSAVMSEVGGEAEVLVTFANDVIDPQATRLARFIEQRIWTSLVSAGFTSA